MEQMKKYSNVFEVIIQSEEFFKEYVKSAQDNGFTVDAPEKFEHYYSAKNSEGNDISIHFNEEEERIIVYAHVD